MRVIVQRNANAHALTRGDAPELVYLNIAARLVAPNHYLAKVSDLDHATSVGRDILQRVDNIPGVDDIYAERHRLILTIAKAFDSDAVVGEVLDAISNATGEPLS